MTVECPACQWPTVLDERGPPEDPSILLTGVARIGSSEAQVVAIRIHGTAPRMPGFRRDVAEEAYALGGLDTFLEAALEDLGSVALDAAELLGGREAGTVELATGHYRIWLMPVSPGNQGSPG